MNKQKTRSIVALIVIVIFAAVMGGCQKELAMTPKPKDNAWLTNWKQQNPTWRGLHLYDVPHDKVATLERLITEQLAPLGINYLILEVNYNFAYQSHPKLAKDNGLTYDDAKMLVKLCRENGIRLIPQFQCLGHQSGDKKTFGLLTKYPRFDETPGKYPENEGIYSRSWCPLHPRVNAVVFDLMDELIDAFDADALHVGMDETFLIGDDDCRRCKDNDHAELFAKAVNDYHKHIVEEKGLEMLMWGDRLLDAEATGYGKWEASTLGTHKAIDLISNDIIICDWHYEKMDNYPSVRIFTEKGFRVLQGTWKDLAAAAAFLDQGQKVGSGKMLGVLFTSWDAGPGGERLFAAISEKLVLTEKDKTARAVAAVMKASLKQLAAADQTAEINVIPEPMKFQRGEGSFLLKYTTRIFAEEGSPEILGAANYLANKLRPATGMGFPVHQSSMAEAAADSILLTTQNADASLGEEGYELVVTKDSVLIRAPKPAGLFHGVQTIRQLLPAEIENRKYVLAAAWPVPCVNITDKPRYKWRGMHLDACRHFTPTTFVKKFIDLLALYKMNTLHWHLTEDQGWRIEIKKYPKLIEQSPWREAEDGSMYGGYYTQEDVRDIVAYAKERFITVVPEIEMPGHSLAALYAYPQFSCTGGSFEVMEEWGISKDVYCAGNDETFAFLENILSEVIELFPGPYLHVGADECPKDRWKECSKCQARIKAEGLKDEHELQSYFIRRIETYLNSKDRNLIGWDEILEGGLAPNATVMSWRGKEGGIASAKQKHDAIMCPGAYCYFDMKQVDLPDEQGHDWAGIVSPEQTYSYEPTPEELTPEEAKYILGAQGNLWSEYMPNESEVEYMALPRMIALSEVVWSPKEHRNWQSFSERMKWHYQRLDVLEVNYFTPRKDVGKIGAWTPEQISTTIKTLEWDITDSLEQQAGDFYINIDYNRGAHGLSVDWVALLEDGREIARDSHESFSGAEDRNNIYKLTVAEVKSDSIYIIHAGARGDGGTDSFGAVWLTRMSP